MMTSISKSLYFLKWCPIFDSSPLHQFSKFNNFLWVCWLLGKILSNFVAPAWKLNNPYYHSANKDEGVFFILYYLTDLFKNEETVFVNREDFIKSVGELNIYVKSVGREVCVLVFFLIKKVLIPITKVHSLMKIARKFRFKNFPVWIKLVNLESDTFGNPIFQKG